MPTTFQTFDSGDTIEDTHIEQFIDPINNIEKGSSWYAAASGSSNAYEVTLSPAPASYTDGMIVHFKTNAGNTGAATLNVNSLGAKTLKKDGATDLASGDLASGQIVCALYDGTHMQVIGIGSGGASGADELDELDDVTLTSPANNEILQHNGAGQFVNRSLASAGIAASGANSDITELSGLTTALGAAYGGTGQLGGFTKGDLLVATGATSLVKLGVGSDGEVLTADSNASAGVAWGAPGGSGSDVTGSGAAYRVAYWDTSSSIKGNGSLAVDDSTGLLYAAGTATLTSDPPSASGTGWRISLGTARGLGNQTYSVDLKCHANSWISLFGSSNPLGNATTGAPDGNAKISFHPDYSLIRTEGPMYLEADQSMVVLDGALSYSSNPVSTSGTGWKLGLGVNRAFGNQTNAIDLRCDGAAWFCLYGEDDPNGDTSATVIDSNAGIGFSPYYRRIQSNGSLTLDPASSMVLYYGGLAYTSSPLATTGTGWKLGIGNDQAFGVQTSSVDLKVGADGWFCLFGTVNPAGDASSTTPDSNSNLSFHPDTNTIRSSGSLALWPHNSMTLLQSSLAYTSDPVSASGTGWKLALGPTRALGNQDYSVDLRTNNAWLSLFGANNPAGNATGSVPDSNARISLNPTSTGNPYIRIEAAGRVELGDQGAIRFFEYDVNGTNYVDLKAPASLSTSFTLTLPSGLGNNGDVLVSDGAGNLSWSPTAAGWSDGGTSIALSTSGDSVGIGTSSPAGKLHVRTASAGGSVSVDADELVVEGSGNSGITVKSGTSSDGALYFGDSGGTAQGSVRYDHATDDLFLGAAGTDLVRLDGSTGDVHVINNLVVEQIPAYASPGAALYAFTSGSVGELHHQSSSRRFKHNIETLEPVSNTLARLRPVRFDGTAPPTDKGGSPVFRASYGLIAEEVRDEMPELVFDLPGSHPEDPLLGVRYDLLPVFILAGWQEQQRELVVLLDELETLKQAVEAN